MNIKKGDTVTVNYPGSQDGSSKPVHATGTVVTVGKHFVVVALQDGTQDIFSPTWLSKK